MNIWEQALRIRESEVNEAGPPNTSTLDPRFKKFADDFAAKIIREKPPVETLSQWLLQVMDVVQRDAKK